MYASIGTGCTVTSSTLLQGSMGMLWQLRYTIVNNSTKTWVFVVNPCSHAFGNEEQLGLVTSANMSLCSFLGGKYVIYHLSNANFFFVGGIPSSIHGTSGGVCQKVFSRRWADWVWYGFFLCCMARHPSRSVRAGQSSYGLIACDPIIVIRINNDNHSWAYKYKNRGPKLLIKDLLCRAVHYWIRKT